MISTTFTTTLLRNDKKNANIFFMFSQKTFFQGLSHAALIVRHMAAQGTVLVLWSHSNYCRPYTDLIRPVSYSTWIFFLQPEFSFYNILDTGPLILTWISSSIWYKMWIEITYPFSNFKGATVEVWEWISNFIPHFSWHVIACPYWD